AVVTKATGDTIAIDEIHTHTTSNSVFYARTYAGLFDQNIEPTSSSDESFERDCVRGTDDQVITATSPSFAGYTAANASCDSTVDSISQLGVRFPNVSVSAGTQVASAYLDLFVNFTSATGPVQFTIYGEDTD